MSSIGEKKLLNFHEINKTGKQTVFLCSGWPDISTHIWQKQVLVLQQKDFRVILIDMPGYGEEEDKSLPLFGYSVDQIASMFRNTYDAVMKERPSAEEPFAVLHDWGSIYVNAAIFNRYTEAVSVSSSETKQKPPKPLFSRVVMLDVGPSFDIFYKFPKMLLVCILYQGLAILSYLCGLVSTALGNSIHRQTCRYISKAPNWKNSRASMGYLYLRLWSLWYYPRSSIPSCRAAMQKQVGGSSIYCDYDDCKVFFAFASGFRDVVSFHQAAWEEYLVSVESQKKGNVLWAVPTIDHWFYARDTPSKPKVGAHVDEFNRRMIEFFR